MNKSDVRVVGDSKNYLKYSFTPTLKEKNNLIMN